MEVDELDIGQVRQGQRAAVTIDAFGDETFEGTVTDIAPSPVSSDADSIVTYEVTITLDTQDQGMDLLSGMTANAIIDTQQLNGVLLVPNRAIQTDRSGTETITYVEKLDSQGNSMRVEIETGLRVGSYTQVLAGLEEGDQVIIRDQSETGTTPNL
jgi:HlyD family secretion protein